MALSESTNPMQAPGICQEEVADGRPLHQKCVTPLLDQAVGLLLVYGAYTSLYLILMLSPAISPISVFVSRFLVSIFYNKNCCNKIKFGLGQSRHLKTRIIAPSRIHVLLRCRANTELSLVAGGPPKPNPPCCYINTTSKPGACPSFIALGFIQ